MENFQDKGVWIRSLKNAWIRIRFVLRGWIRFVLRGWIRIRFVLRGWIRIRFRNPAHTATNIKTMFPNQSSWLIVEN